MTDEPSLFIVVSVWSSSYAVSMVRAGRVMRSARESSAICCAASASSGRVEPGDDRSRGPHDAGQRQDRRQLRTVAVDRQKRGKIDLAQAAPLPSG